MTTAGVVLLVVGIVVANALILGAVVVWLRTRMRKYLAALAERFAASGEWVAIPPASGVYRGANRRFPKVKGVGALALTERHIAFLPLIGRGFDVPCAEIVEVREDKWFLRSSTGRLHLIVRLSDGTEVGFFPGDHARWVAALGAGQRAGSM